MIERQVETMASKPATIQLVSEQIATGKISSSLLTDELLKKIFNLNQRINLFITITDEKARKSAKETDKRVASPSKRVISRLDGIPIAIKDNFFIRGVRCTAGSKILSNFVPEYSAPVVEKLEKAGAVILGTTNLHEFASGVTNVNPHYGTARNPCHTDRITGGSSGGSAAVVAAGLAFAALGTDTSGSVRIPASLCGVVGLKPTYGLVSTRNTIPLAPSLDHVGILTRSCVDAAIVLELVSGYDELDPNSVKAPGKYDYVQQTLRARDDNLHYKIGVPRNSMFLEPLSEEVHEAFEKVKINLRSLGFELGEVEIPSVEVYRETWAPIRFSEASAYHDLWLKSRPGDYGEDVRRMLERGREFSGVEYIKAKKQATELRKNMMKILEDLDAIITPTTPIPAPKISETDVSIGSFKTDIYSTLVRQTLPFNVTGLPAVSIPMGLSKHGLPFGLQIVGKEFDEGTILGIGSAYEKKFGRPQSFQCPGNN
jgi:aspartyl-tRNA(Asn)/glutamyl-tRNA(Gln) amidotransferase subunit A